MELSPRKRFRAFIAGFKYEILLLALFQHLFIGIVLRDLPNYTRSVWPVTVIILVIASTGVFYGKGRIKNILRVVLGIVVIEFPILLTYYGYPAILMQAVSISYFLLYKPGYYCGCSLRLFSANRDLCLFSPISLLRQPCHV